MNKTQKTLIIFIGIIIIFIAILYFIIVSMTENITTTNNNTYYESDNTVNIQDYNDYIYDTDNYISTENHIISDTTSNLTNLEYVEQEITNSDKNRIKYVNNRSTYFTVQILVENYINLIGNNIVENLNNVLAPSYISRYNITTNNISQVTEVPELKTVNQQYKTIITDMTMAEVEENTYIYLVKGKTRVTGTNKSNDFYIMLQLNDSNSLYCIYPNKYITDNGYNTLKVGDIINYVPEKLEKKDNNQFVYTVKNDLEVANQYFDTYKELLLYYSDEAYSKLDSEYASKRFGNKEGFKLYLKEYSTHIALLNINKYQVDSYQDYTDYICIDQFDNIYIFKQNGGIMRYSVFLDQYTVPRQADIEEYNKAEENNKAKYHLDTFIDKINTKDYTAIYNNLDSTFKKNNCNSIEELKKYIKNCFYEYNEITLKDYWDRDGYSVFSCQVKNMQQRSQIKDVTVIIKLGENMTCTMSFSE